MSICSKCGKRHSRGRGGKNPYPASYCAACHAEYTKAKRKSWDSLNPEQKRRSNARAYANVYLRRGKLKRLPCEVCGAWAQMHHDDYSKPLEVRWLCRRHHGHHHAVIAPMIEFDPVI